GPVRFGRVHGFRAGVPLPAAWLPGIPCPVLPRPAEPLGSYVPPEGLAELREWPAGGRTARRRQARRGSPLGPSACRTRSAAVPGARRRAYTLPRRGWCGRPPRAWGRTTA